LSSTRKNAICLACGLLVPILDQSQDEDGTWVITVDWDSHECKPHLLRFFDRNSQHEPPFQR
jgi:hypothetical protein